MASNGAIEDEPVANGVENSDEEEVDETGKTDDQNDAAKAKKKRKKKKKNKGRERPFVFIEKKSQFHSDLAQTVTTDGQAEVDAVPNGTEAIATLTLQPDGRSSFKENLFH